MLDMHGLGADENNGLWHDGTYSETAVNDAWETMVLRYKDTWNVFGADIFNEVGSFLPLSPFLNMF